MQLNEQSFNDQFQLLITCEEIYYTFSLLVKKNLNWTEFTGGF